MKNSNDLFVRINSGKHKGRKIALPSLETTRSTKSIIRESFFNTVQFEIIGKIFVEVFAGSGSMGLEALSRGAKRVYFIEKDPDAYKILRENIKTLGCEVCEAINGDSFIEFPRLIERIDEKSYFYFDPPFEIREGMDEVYEKTYRLIKKIPEEICEMITIEHMSSIKIPQQIGIYSVYKSKKFGKTTLTYLKY